MKKILFLLIVLFALVSCEKDPVIDKGKLDPNATILIRAGKGVKTRAFVSDLTGLEIVEQTMNMTFKSHYFSGIYYDEIKILDRGFGDNQRDFDIPALKMFGTDIIETDGRFIKDFLYGTEFYLVNQNVDTIGYIPQSVIDNARILIETAYNDENYTEVYDLFNTAFTFLPISE